MKFEQLQALSLGAREALLESLDSRLLEHDRNRTWSLMDFVREAWHVLEPETPLVEGGPLPLMCAALEAVSNGDIDRLLINVPPGCMKSLLVNVFWPAWEWGPRRMAHLRYISASYEQGLATRDLVRCRDLVKSEWFQARWQITFKDDQDQKTYYENSRTGWQLSASVRAALTGYRGDRVRIDDPHSVRGAESDAELAETDSWFTETLPTRVNRAADHPTDPRLKRSGMVMIMQRLSVRDLSAAALALEWEHLCLPMRYEADHPHVASTPILRKLGIVDTRKEGDLLWPERFPDESVTKLEKALSLKGGRYAVAGQLQQRPVPRGGGMFAREHAHFVDVAPPGVRWCRGWDLAGTEGGGKATAGVKVGEKEGRIYIGDCAWGQKEPHGVEVMIKAAAKQDGKRCTQSLPQDPGQAGKAQKAALGKLLAGYDVHFSTESGDKADRAIPLSAQWEAGNVYLVRGDWNDPYLAEMGMFTPAAKGFTDRVDATSRGYACILTRPARGQSFGAPAEIVTSS